MIQVRIANISVDSFNNAPVVLLRPISAQGSFVGDRVLPIWIGHPEAMAILLGLQGVEAPRPLTHDLFLSTLAGLGYQLERVEITRLEDGTFFAEMVLSGSSGGLVVDARPSDSMALAVRAGCDILVAEAVMDEAAVTPEPSEDDEVEVERFREFLEHVDPNDFTSH